MDLVTTSESIQLPRPWGLPTRGTLLRQMKPVWFGPQIMLDHGPDRFLNTQKNQGIQGTQLDVWLIFSDILVLWVWKWTTLDNHWAKSFCGLCQVAWATA
jgi:hypothetical protein